MLSAIRSVPGLGMSPRLDIRNAAEVQVLPAQKVRQKQCRKVRHAHGSSGVMRETMAADAACSIFGYHPVRRS